MTNKKSNIVHIADVGWRDEGADRAHRLYVMRNEVFRSLFYGRVPRYDHIDLANGRDFLNEKRHYDVVVLHRVYALVHEVQGGPLDSYTAISPSHSPQVWRERLCNTRAKVIYTFGMHHGVEVDSSYLGELPKYKIDVPRFPENVDVYVREEA